MQSVSLDLCHFQGDEFLLLVDRYSKWVDCHKLSRSTAEQVIPILDRFFCDFGNPETLVSDNGPPFSSHAFAAFLLSRGVQHITSSPHYPRSNGLAERHIQTVKCSLRKAVESGQSLLQVLSTLRSTPLGEGLPSPSVLLQARNLRGPLLSSPFQLKHVFVNDDAVRETLQARQSKSTGAATSGHTLIPLSVGQQIWCQMGQRHWVPGQVVKHDAAPNSYWVRLGDGRTLRRNRHVLKPARVEPHSPIGPASPFPVTGAPAPIDPGLTVEAEGQVASGQGDVSLGGSEESHRENSNDTPTHNTTLAEAPSPPSHTLTPPQHRAMQPANGSEASSPQPPPPHQRTVAQHATTKCGRAVIRPSRYCD